jgi:hypothetical protein
MKNNKQRFCCWCGKIHGKECHDLNEFFKTPEMRKLINNLNNFNKTHENTDKNPKYGNV